KAHPELVAKELGHTPDRPAIVNTIKNRLNQPAPRVAAPASTPPAGPAKPESQGPIWPVILASLAFAYLWWIAAILFDLTVIWHHSIRQAAILARLEELRHRLREGAAQAVVGS